MALGSVMLAWCFTRTGAKAPRRPCVMSVSARPVAMAYLKTWDLVLTLRYPRDPGVEKVRLLKPRILNFWEIDDDYLTGGPP